MRIVSGCVGKNGSDLLAEPLVSGSVCPFVSLGVDVDFASGCCASDVCTPAFRASAGCASPVELSALSAFFICRDFLAFAIKSLKESLCLSDQPAPSKFLSLIWAPIFMAYDDVEAMLPCVRSQISRSFSSSFFVLGRLESQFAFHIMAHSLYLFSIASFAPEAGIPMSCSFFLSFVSLSIAKFNIGSLSCVWAGVLVELRAVDNLNVLGFVGTGCGHTFPGQSVSRWRSTLTASILHWQIGHATRPSSVKHVS